MKEPNLSTSSNMSLRPPEKPRQLARMSSGRPSPELKSWIAWALEVGLVDGRAEQLVERHVAGEDDGCVALLDHALAETEDVRPNANVARSAIREREDFAVGNGRLSGDGTGALERLHAEALLVADNSHNPVVVADGRLLCLVLIFIVNGRGIDTLSNYRIAEGLLVLVGEPQVGDTLGRVVAADPLYAEALLHCVGETELSAGVGGHIDAWHTTFACVLRGAFVNKVLLRAKGAIRERDVVGDHDDGAAARHLGRVESDAPGNHAYLIGPRLLRVLERDDARPIGREGELGRHHLLRRRGERGVRGGGALPRGGERNVEQMDVVVAVGGAKLLALEALLIDNGKQRVRLERYRRLGGCAACALRRAYLAQPERAVVEADLLKGIDPDRWAEPTDDARNRRRSRGKVDLGCRRVPQR
eukprot:scaffold138644_cov26-Tisochrysis_lutea.AAC.3